MKPTGSLHAPVPVPNQSIILAGHCHLTLQRNRVRSCPDAVQDADVVQDHVPLSQRQCQRRLSWPGAPFPDSLDSSHNNSAREHIGGKGHFLHRMQETGLPVPPFQCVNTQMVKAIEDWPVNITLLRQHLPALAELNQPFLSLSEIKQWISTFPPEQNQIRKACLTALSGFIESQDFFQQVVRLPIVSHIQELYNGLGSQSQPVQSLPVIIRSSGVAEDNFGDAQAGRYQSVVHGSHHILHSCLKVLASGYRPEACIQGVPQTMAIILQRCIRCSIGGVVMSYSSLKDDTIRVEYVSGQPKGAVGGQAGITPHRYDIERNGNSFEARMSPGYVPTVVTLQTAITGQGFDEREETPDIHDMERQCRMGSEQLKALYQSINKLENLLLCPVDAEFGIDYQGQLYLLQVRPMTRLVGGMTFSVAEPSNPVLSGELVSEGLGSGILCLVDQSHSATHLQENTVPENTVPENAIPENAIIVAEHCYEWMLEADCLKKAGGFIFKRGGINDHPAITLRQAGKPCLLAGAQYERLQNLSRQSVTLIAGQFGDKTGAYLLPGNRSEDLKNNMSTASANYDSLLKQPQPEPSLPASFDRPDTGFQWLNRQNYRMLAYFDVHHALHHCLFPERCLQLSMSPQREEVLERFQQEIHALLEDAKIFIAGYEQFLRLDKSNNQQVLMELKTLEELRKVLSQLEQDIGGQVSSMVGCLMSHPSSNSYKRAMDPMGKISFLSPRGDGKGISIVERQERNFQQWIETGRTLQEKVLALHQPDNVHRVTSLHDLIYLVHKQFVSSLQPVAVGSGQGRKIPTMPPVFIDFCPINPDDSQESVSLFNTRVEDALRSLDCKKVTLNLPGVLITSLELGIHKAVVEMLEAAEGGKGRTLRVRFSDNIRADRLQGALKRFWFLAYSLKRLSLGGEGNTPTIKTCKVTGEIFIEFTHIPSKKILQDGFDKLIDVLNGIEHFNTYGDTRFDSNTSLWDFSILNARLSNPSFDSHNEAAFRFVIFSDAYKFGSIWCYPRFNIHRIDLKYYRIHNWAATAYNMSSDEINDNLSHQRDEQKKEYLYLLLLVAPEKAGQLIFGEYKYLFHNDDIINAVRQNYKVLKVIPEQQKNDEMVYAALEQSSDAFQFATATIKDDKTLLLSLLAAKPELFQYASKRLQADDQCAREAISRFGRNIGWASDAIQKDESFQDMALENDPLALEFASEQIKNNGERVSQLIDRNYHALEFASEELRNSLDFVSPIIQQHNDALEYVGDRLKNDRNFILTHIGKYGFLLKDLSEKFRNDQDIVLEAMLWDVVILKYAGDNLKRSTDFMEKAISIDVEAFIHASKEIKDNTQIVINVVKKNGDLLKEANNRLKDYFDVVLAAVGNKGSSLLYASDNMKKNEVVVLKALENDGDALQFAEFQIRQIKKFVLVAVKNNYRALYYADDDLKNDWEVVAAAVENDQRAWQYAGKEITRAITKGEVPSQYQYLLASS